MGGYGSGLHNRSYRPTVEHSLRLSAHALREARLFRAGERTAGCVTGIGLEVDLRSDRAPRLTAAWNGSRATIALRATPQPFGNVRWWLVCPGCRQRRDYLYHVHGDWRCQTCHGLVYASQRADKARRYQWSADRLLRRLGATPGQRTVAKPWKLRRVTFERIMARVDRLDQRVLEIRLSSAQ